MTVLAGDWLYMQSFQIALEERNFHVLDILIDLTQKMVEGELIQLAKIGRMDVTEEDALKLSTHKTACLFSGCARLGAVLGGFDERHEEALADCEKACERAEGLVRDLATSLRAVTLARLGRHAEAVAAAKVLATPPNVAPHVLFELARAYFVSARAVASDQGFDEDTRGRLEERYLASSVALIERARGIGYRSVLLDTLPAMSDAQALYASCGFTPTSPYRFNPVAGATYWKLDL